MTKAACRALRDITKKSFRMTTLLQLQAKQRLQTALQALWNKQMNRRRSFTLRTFTPLNPTSLNPPALRRATRIPFNCYTFTAAAIITADINIYFEIHGRVQ